MKQLGGMQVINPSDVKALYHIESNRTRKYGRGD